jgi:hypothetical protein
MAATPRRSTSRAGRASAAKKKPPPSPLMKESVSHIKKGMALERSFSSSGKANDGELAAGEYRIACELMESLSTDDATPRSMRQALGKKAVEVQRRLDSLESKLPSDSRARAQAVAATARAQRQEAAEAVAAAVQVQAVVRGRQARAAAAAARAEQQQQHVAATRIQAHRRGRVARAEMARARAAMGVDDELTLEERYSDSELDEEDAELMGMLMSPGISHDLAGPPPLPPPPKVYAEALAERQRELRELEAEPAVSPVDPPRIMSVASAGADSIRPLLHRAMHTVASTAALHTEAAALDFIARSFIAGELLPLEPEPEPEARPSAATSVSGDQDWSAGSTLSSFLGSLEAKVGAAMSAGLVQHLQASQEPPNTEWKHNALPPLPTATSMSAEEEVLRLGSNVYKISPGDEPDHLAAARALAEQGGGLISLGEEDEMGPEFPPTEVGRPALAEQIGRHLLSLCSGRAAPPVGGGGADQRSASGGLLRAQPAADAEAERLATLEAEARARAEAEAEAKRLQAEAELRRELGELRVSALRKRAYTYGAEEETVEEAEDSDSPKEALIDLCLRSSSRWQEAAAGS